MIDRACDFYKVMARHRAMAATLSGRREIN
jgi:hypothetical protein